MYQLRDYQQKCSDAAINFFNQKSKKNGLLVVPTGAGKSIIIADIASRLNGDVLVLQPGPEILEQNYDKYCSYGFDNCSIYSASLNKKKISKVTFATIGSIMAHKDDFNHFLYIIVDEAHVVNPQGGQYKELFESAQRRILGLTATPYRLGATLQYIENGKDIVYRPSDKEKSLEFDTKILKGDITSENKCILKFLTRTRPRIFTEVIYQVDILTLLKRGYLAQMNYYDMTILRPDNIKRNSTGMDYDDEDLKSSIKNVGLQSHLINIVRRLLNPKNGVPRKGILVFTKFLQESESLCQSIPGCVMVTGKTPKRERKRILDSFKKGEIRVVTNVGVLTTGFDYPELDTIVIARPTMSLALYYQIVGRAIRPHPSKKSGWVIDLCGNIDRFGKVEDLHLTERSSGLYAIESHSNGRMKQLTNILF